MTLRRQGREIALKILYKNEWEPVEDLDEVLDDFRRFLASTPLESDHPSILFARELLEGILSRLAELDGLLKSRASRWRLDRMASVDRNILRIGAYELCHRPEIPPKVAINEAVELAKNFGTVESSAFVNGILDAIYRNDCQGTFAKDADEYSKP